MKNIITWTFEAPQKKSNTTLATEYVINELGIFSKTEIRNYKTGFLPQVWGFKDGMDDFNNGHYTKDNSSRGAILWHKITQVFLDEVKYTILIGGQEEEDIELQCGKNRFMEIASILDDKVAEYLSIDEDSQEAYSWRGWSEDDEWDVPEASLEQMIDYEINEGCKGRNLEDVQDLPVSLIKRKHESKQCLYCHEKLEDDALFCPSCGKKN